MLTKRTVLVLGAGCSQPYGYPLGKDLVKKITEISRTRNSKIWGSSLCPKDTDGRIQDTVLRELADLLKGADVDSIDKFLPTLVDCKPDFQ